MHEINRIKFWPPVILLTITLLLSLLDKELFLLSVQSANSWVLTHFDWLFSWSVLCFFLIIIAIYFSPLGRVTIGGIGSQPILTKWRWFSITLCTTIATGILFWGTAEPLFHFNAPPQNLGIDARSESALSFSLSTIFMHWTLSPYSIYTLSSLVFAYAFYNLKKPFEVSSTLSPILGTRTKYVADAVDVICLYGLVAGMAASLGSGILTLSGGLVRLFDINNSHFLLGIIAVTIVVSFVLSASSGLQKGIKTLSDINIKAFMLLALFFLAFGPTKFIFTESIVALKEYVIHFFPRSVNWNNQLDTDWFQSWTIFNWANWLAWAPISALFLGRLGKGYTIRTFIRINLLYPSIFGMVWMSIFSGTSLFQDQASGGQLFEILNTQGAENVIYEIANKLPASEWISGFFILISFISYVTAADSNTSAMSNLCTKGITESNQDSPLSLQIMWGIFIGAFAWIMITFAGIDGIKMISVLGGFPALFLIIAIGISALKLIYQHFSSSE
ncbi:MAG: BCCT family transporter [Cyclobacteriaceae bacterium]